MKVIYRMCGIPSTNPSPILQEDKFELNRVCLASFIDACVGIVPRMHILCDFCDESYRNMIDQTLPFEWLKDTEIEFTRIGINATALRSYEIASQADDIVLFQECDYIYIPNSMKLLIQATKELGLVSPYDHRNFYVDRSIHSEVATIKLINDHHFRSTERNTMTFMMRPDVIKNGLSILNKYGYLDSDVWHELRALGYPLYVPIPSLATHMVQDWLAPSVDWQEIWKTHTIRPPNIV